MSDVLLWIGRIAGVVGAVLCVVAVLVRLSGQFWVAGFQVGTVLLGGTAAMMAGCLCFLWLLTERSRRA